MRLSRKPVNAIGGRKASDWRSYNRFILPYFLIHLFQLSLRIIRLRSVLRMVTQNNSNNSGDVL